MNLLLCFGIWYTRKFNLVGAFQSLNTIHSYLLIFGEKTHCTKLLLLIFESLKKYKVDDLKQYRSNFYSKETDSEWI